VAFAQATDQTSPATDGKALFARAAEAMGPVQAATYALKITVTNKEGTGPATSYIAMLNQNATANVLQRRQAGAVVGGWLCRFTGSMTDEKGVTTELDFAWKASSIEIVKHKEKKVEERAGRGINGPGFAMATNARMPELFGATPFAAELQGTAFDLEPEKTVSGEVCDVVVVTTKDGKSKARWAFARSDGLPRMKQSINESGMLEGIITYEISNLTIDTNSPPQLSEEQFKVDVPEGFAEDRQQAVVRPTTPVVPAAPDAASPATDSKPVQPDAQPQVQPDSKPEVKPQGPRAAAEFELSTPAGEKMRLSDFKGTPVVLQFFGSWCLPCRDWHAALGNAAKQAGEPTLLALSVRERDGANATQELASANAGWTHLLAAEEVAKTYEVSVYPTTLVIDAEGMIRLAIEGGTSAEDATKVTETLRALPSASKQARN
jgi:peroxiredoxin